MIELAILLIVVGSSIWVLADASRIGARSGLLSARAKTGSVSADYGPGGWFLCCLLMWIIAFPMYLSTRQKIIDAVAFEARVARKDPRLYKPVDQVEEWANRQARESDDLACPNCRAKIIRAAIRAGENVCQKCGASFEVEMA